MIPLLEMKKISKNFPGVKANEDVDLSLNKGEIRAVVGENGAGKTTLMKILYGMYQPDSGEIFLNGKLQNFHSPNDAIKMGIGMIHQHFMLIPSLTALENIILGAAPTRELFFIDKEKAKDGIQTLMDRYSLAVPLNAITQDLSAGIRQRIEILKELYRNVDILILDEPTAILTPQETDNLLKMLREFADFGKTIVFISHKLREVKAVADNITVMSKGVVIDTVRASEVTEHDIARMMVGRDILFNVAKEEIVPGEKVLEIKNLHIMNRRDLPAIRGINLSLKSREIVGIAGVEGNGQFELVECLSGMWPARRGEIQFKGRDITNTSVYKRREMGIAHIPEDRLKTGLCTEMTLWENIIMGFHKNSPFVLFNGARFNRSYISQFTRNCIRKFNIKIPNENQFIKILSGGNLQKTVLAREISHEPELLIVSQPTRGVDMGAVEFIHRELVDLRDQGCALLLVSADLQELMKLSDRLLVIYNGELVSEFQSKEFDEQKIGYHMAGLHGMEVK